MSLHFAIGFNYLLSIAYIKHKATSMGPPSEVWTHCLVVMIYKLTVHCTMTGYHYWI